MIIEFAKQAKKDFEHFKSNNSPEYQKIKDLIHDIIKNPLTGLGKPEQLKGNLSGLHSRRITKQHRLVYKYTRTKIFILSCRYHY